MKTINIKLNVWRQDSPTAKGRFVKYDAPGISPDASFLEMLDIVNERLTENGEMPIAFEHDCREGICGSCGLMINGVAHGPKHHDEDKAAAGIKENPATCQLHMRSYKEGDEITIEPWRSKSFPVIRDLMVDRSPLDRIIQAGGFISVNTGSAPEANMTRVPKDDAELSMDAAACIQCGACVAQCPNGAAQLFTAAKISQLGLLPQGQPERYTRAISMVETMEQYFGSCTNYRECEAVCPKGISVNFIARMNRDYIKAKFMRGGNSNDA
jgi:succinate dehydrogenase / fumarate reductase, iron-sulfur subunit